MLIIVILLIIVGTLLGFALVAGTSDHISADAAKSTADGGAFETASALMTDNAAKGRAAKGSSHSADLGIRPGGAGGEGEKQRSCESGSDFGFHRTLGERMVTELWDDGDGDFIQTPVSF